MMSDIEMVIGQEDNEWQTYGRIGLAGSLGGRCQDSEGPM
jgi:hypothetical protein